MKYLFIIITLVTATIYHADPAQCNDEYWITASGVEIDTLNPIKHRWVAVSRDLEKLGFTFNTKICVEGAGNLDGEWIVQDRMNKRWKKRIDFLVNKSRKGGKWHNVKIYILK